MMKIVKILHCPFAVLLGTLIISTLALALALIGEYVFDLKPCILCLYQRVPFALVIVVSFAGLLLGKIKGRESKPLLHLFIGANALLFFVNAVIAFYHSGVEQKWWKSFLEGCAVPDLDPSQDILAQIQTMPSVACDDPAWVDPILGLSMANLNVPFCLGLAGICVYSIAAKK